MPVPDHENSVEDGNVAAVGEAPKHRDPSPARYWSSIGLGIVLAGGAYPPVVAFIYFVTGVAVVFWRQVSGVSDLPSVTDLIGAGSFLAVYVAVGGIVGIVWASVVCLLTLPLVHLFVLSLRLRVDPTWLAAFSGGLVGFVAVLPVMLPILLRFSSTNGLREELAACAMVALGPGLSTILGQLGGVWGAQRHKRRETKRRRRETLIATGSWLAPSDESTIQSDQPKNGVRRSKLQFSIRHLLLIAVWLSLLLSVIRLSGIPFEFVLPLLVGWSVYQAVMLWAGWFVWQRVVSRRQAGREHRST
jgi:hypothetical protein